MKNWVKFTLAIVVILTASVILSPILYKNLPWDFKFERIFNRIFMIGTLGAVILFVRIRRETLEKYGLIWRSGSAGLAMKGFFLGVGTLLALAGVKASSGAVTWAPSVSVLAFFLKALGIFLTAFLIGIIEEFFFRGFIYDSFRKRFQWPLLGALLATNVFYSLVHFVAYRKPFIDDDPGFLDSLRLAVVPFTQLQYFPEYWHAALGLFIFGLVLNFIRIHTDSLYPAIGLHAGCVFFIKTDGMLVNYLNPNPLFWSGEKMYDGAVGWVFLAAMSLVVPLLFPKRNGQATV